MTLDPQKTEKGTPASTGEPLLLADANKYDVVFFKRTCRAGQIVNPLRVVDSAAKLSCYLRGEGVFADRTKYPYPIVLFLNLRLPDVDGFRMLEMIRASDEHAKLPVIVLSNLSDLKLMKDAYQKGATSFLLKPVTLNELLNSLRALPSVELSEDESGSYELRSSREQPS